MKYCTFTRQENNIMIRESTKEATGELFLLLMKLSSRLYSAQKHKNISKSWICSWFPISCRDIFCSCFHMKESFGSVCSVYFHWLKWDKKSPRSNKKLIENDIKLNVNASTSSNPLSSPWRSSLRWIRTGDWLTSVTRWSPDRSWPSAAPRAPSSTPNWSVTRTRHPGVCWDRGRMQDSSRFGSVHPPGGFNVLLCGKAAWILNGDGGRGPSFFPLTLLSLKCLRGCFNRLELLQWHMWLQ